MENKKEVYLKEFYTLEDLSKELAINIQSLRKFIKDGKLKASKLGTKYIVSRSDILEWMEQNRV